MNTKKNERYCNESRIKYFIHTIIYFVIVFRAWNNCFFSSKGLIMTRPRGMGIFASIVQACHDMSETTLKATLLGKKK